MISELKNRIQDINNYDGRGTSSKCYLIDDFALLYGAIELNTIEYKKQLIDSYIAKGISIAPILEYQIDIKDEERKYEGGSIVQNGWTLQQRAGGEVLYDNWVSSIDINNISNITIQYREYLSKIQEYSSRIKQFSEIPQEQIDKFIKDYSFLIKSSLLVDPSKPTNFFYDENDGFTFIDLNIKPENINKEFENDNWMSHYIIMLLTPVIPTINIYQEGYRRHGLMEFGDVTLSADILISIKDSLSKIMVKLKQGLLNNGVSQEIINEEVLKRLQRFENIDQNSNVNLDEANALNLLATKLNKIIAENAKNEVISDQQHSENYKGIRISF